MIDDLAVSTPMPTVFIPSQLRKLTGGIRQLEVDAANVREVVEQLERQFPGIKGRLCRGEAIAPGLAVSVDGEISTKGLLAAVKPGSELHFLPAIGGG